MNAAFQIQLNIECIKRKIKWMLKQPTGEGTRLKVQGTRKAQGTRYKAQEVAASGIRHQASCIRHHSYLSASIGFNLAALSAG